MDIFDILKLILSCVIGILLFGNVVYPTVALLFRKKYYPCGKLRRKYAVMICARNEENVIGNLVDSLKFQDYPAELLDIYVLANNCDDFTAQVAASHGAEVFIRNDKTRVGKGFALNYLYAKIILKKGNEYDGFFIFDADNLLPADYVSKMNASFKGGNSVLTGIRNSKNFGDNWITAGYSIGWLFQTGLLNEGRKVLGIPCFVNGTGFLIGADVLRQSGGWNWFTLTEDCEFTVNCALNGVEIGICHDAEFYDEQPSSFIVSWKQRLRWTKGKYQMFKKYGFSVFKKIFSNRPHIFLDAFCNVVPSSLLILLSAVISVIELVIISPSLIAFASSVGMILIKSYVSMLFLGFLTVALWWRKIRATSLQKILLTLFYPIHLALYIPITFVAAFKRVEWTPIKHDVSISIKELSENKKTPTNV